MAREKGLNGFLESRISLRWRLDWIVRALSRSAEGEEAYANEAAQEKQSLKEIVLHVGLQQLHMLLRTETGCPSRRLPENDST